MELPTRPCPRAVPANRAVARAVARAPAPKWRAPQAVALLAAGRANQLRLRRRAVLERERTEVKPLAEEPPKDSHQLIVLLVAAAYVIWQMDKVNMSVAILPMATDFSWDTQEQGLIQSSIFWGYAATQVLGGWLSTKFGGKRVLLFAVALWSLATMLAPLAATVSTEAEIHR